MRWLFCLLWLFCSGGAMAAALPLYLPSNVAASGTSYVTKASAAFSGAAFNSALTSQVAGKLVTVPATWRLASNAGQVATAALRLNPGYATAAVLTWLVGYGIQKCVNGSLGSWCTAGTPEQAPNGKPYPESGGYWSLWTGWTQNYSADGQVLCNALANDMSTHNGGTYTCQGFSVLGNGNLSMQVKMPNNNIFNGTATKQTGCIAGHTLTNGMCVPPGYVAASDEAAAADTSWMSPAQGQLPDSVLNDLIGNVSLPLNPEVNPATQTVPLSDPYTDPVTGKRYKDVAYVTPSPSSPTKTADLQVGKQEVDAEGNPVTDPNTGGPKAPEETDDPCLAHPERLGCMEKGEIPAAPDLEGDERTITITPQGGWGADTAACPADLMTTLRQGGVPVAFSFKPVCDGADMFRPVIIGMAWIAAVLIALGVGRKGD